MSFRGDEGTKSGRVCRLTGGRYGDGIGGRLPVCSYTSTGVD